MRLHAKRVCTFLLMLCVLAVPALAQAKDLIQSKPASSISSWDAEDPSDLSADNLYAQSAILIDAKTGQTLFSKKPQTRLYPASTTKIMTTMLALEKCDLKEIVTIDRKATLVEPSNLGVQAGEEYTVEDLLYGLMMVSANDVSIALAIHIGGSVEGFAEMMNKKAQELGARDTHFSAPHGLTAVDHYSTVEDMALIARTAMQNETFRKIVSMPKYTISPTNLRDTSNTITNKNKMLPTSGDMHAYEWSIGIKTGYTNAAQHTYVGAAQRDGVSLIAVVFGTTSDGKWLDTNKLFEYGFARYGRVDVAALYASNPTECTVTSCDEGDTGILRLDIKDPSSLNGIIDTKENIQAIQENFASAISVEYVKEVVAPVEAGDVIAKLTYQYGESPAITVDLVAARAVTAQQVSARDARVDVPGMPLTIDQIADNAVNSPIRYLAWLLLVPVLLLIGLLLSMGVEISRRRRRRGHSGRRYYSTAAPRRR